MEATRERMELARERAAVLRAPSPAFPRLRKARTLAPWTRASLAVDVLMLAAAVFFAELGAPRAGIPSPPAIWLAAFPVLVVGLFGARGMYRPRLFLKTLDELRAVVTSTALAGMAVLSLRVLLSNDPWVAAQTARLWAFACVYLLAGRAVLSWAELQARKRGESTAPTLVIGAGKVGRLTARRLLDHPELGLQPVGFLDKEPLEDQDGDGLPVLGASWDLERVVADQGVKHVIVSFSTAPQHVLRDLLKRCETLGVQVSFVPRFFEKMTGHIGVEYLGGLPLITPQPTNPRSWQFSVKYAADRMIAAALIILLAPVLLGAAAAVLVALGRPLFFRQPRVGRDGLIFPMLKFRTMAGAPDEAGEADADWAEEQLSGGAVHATVAVADRSTPAGRFLRRFSLDELPQLFNVVRGEMSIVGPRPERMHYVELFQENVYRYGDRHRVKSGITGWAQVNGLRGKTSLADRVEWDNYYIENWSLWLDVKILLMTLLAVLTWRPSE